VCVCGVCVWCVCVCVVCVCVCGVCVCVCVCGVCVCCVVCVCGVCRVITALSNLKEYFYPTFIYTESTLFCLLSEVIWRHVVLKFEHVAMPLRTATWSIAIGNEKLQSWTTSADTSAGEVSLLVEHNNAHLAGSNGRWFYDVTANNSLSAARCY